MSQLEFLFRVIVSAFWVFYVHLRTFIGVPRIRLFEPLKSAQYAGTPNSCAHSTRLNDLQASVAFASHGPPQSNSVFQGVLEDWSQAQQVSITCQIRRPH